MVIKIANQLGKRLQGRVFGRKHFAQVCEYLANASQGEIVFLDFQGVEHITGSWINSMIVPLFRWSCDGQNNLFPILCNIHMAWLDEFRLIADWNHQCYLLVSDVKEPPGSAQLIGSLESVQKKSLEVVLQEGRVTGAELERKMPDEHIKATAWNNRLKDLFEKRLVRREKRGREQVYFPVVKEVK